MPANIGALHLIGAVDLQIPQRIDTTAVAPGGDRGPGAAPDRFQAHRLPQPAHPLAVDQDPILPLRHRLKSGRGPHYLPLLTDLRMILFQQPASFPHRSGCLDFFRSQSSSTISFPILASSGSHTFQRLASSTPKAALPPPHGHYIGLHVSLIELSLGKYWVRSFVRPSPAQP